MRVEEHVEEQQAIRRLKQGDMAGLAVLVRRYQAPAIQAAYLITHDNALAEDVVQDVFLQVYRSIGRFDADRPFKPWFMRSVVNAAVYAARRDQRHVSLDAASGDDDLTFADLLPDTAPAPDDQAELAEIADAVEQALERLSPDQRAAIVLRYYLDLSDDEMSEQLDCAPSTVRWRLHAARKQLGAILRRWHVDRPTTG